MSLRMEESKHMSMIAELQYLGYDGTFLLENKRRRTWYENAQITFMKRLAPPARGVRNTGEQALLVPPRDACGAYVGLVGPA